MINPNQVVSAAGTVQQMQSGAPYYGAQSSGAPGAGGLLSTTSKRHGAGGEAAGSALGESGAPGGGPNGLVQAQNTGNGSHQYRNSKNRKLYTSIGAYN